MTFAVDHLPAGPWAAAVVDDGVVELRSAGLPDDARLEIGSISKGLTAMLYVDAIERGEVSEDDVLGQYLTFDNADIAAISLASLAVHRSGLPSVPTGLALRRTATWLVAQRNPYGDTLAELLEQLTTTRLTPGRQLYSNLGFQLLGHAVAAAAGMPYRELLQQRIAEPLGLSSLVVPAHRSELEPCDVIGRGRYGRRAQPWTGEALGPAGAVRMTIADLATLAARLLDGSAPGVSCLEPVTGFIGPGMRIGAGWITSGTDHGPVTWHNGGTGGFRSWVGLDRQGGRAAMLVRARGISADHHGMKLLAASG